MTTTLRPECPEEPLPGGGRSRRWQICVNGRPVGQLRTTAVPHGDQRWGELSELHVIPQARRRGRATVGVLAAEEVLRDWGCARVDVTVPAEADPALRLARLLGYTERMRNLAKRLALTPALPPELTVRPLAESEYDAWLSHVRAGYLAALRSSGLTEQQARQKCDADNQHVLPQRQATPGAVLRQLCAPDGTVLGGLWVTLRQRTLPGGRPLAWVMAVDVPEEHRGQGHGRLLMRLAEHECLAAGVRDLGLNVFTGNQVAIGLYTSFGYRVTHRVLGKPLC